NLASTETFTVNGATAQLVNTIPGTNGAPSTVVSLVGGSIGSDVINSRGYIEITFTPTHGNTIDAATINGGEFKITDASGNVVALTGTPTREGSSNTWQYHFSGQLALGTYTVTFVAGSFADSAGIVNQAQTELFTVDAPTAALTDPTSGGVQNQASINSGLWIDVTYADIAGQSIDPNSLTSGNQFTITDSNGDTLAQDGNPVEINTSTNTFRYFFTGYTGGTNVTFTVNFTPGTWANTGGTVSQASDPAPTYATPQPGTWIDAVLTPTQGQTVDQTTLSEGAVGSKPATVTLSGSGLGTIAAYTGTSPIVELDPNTSTFRFLYTGGYSAGTVNVTFAAGGWADTGGNQGSASSASFTVIAPAQSFFIDLSGGIILNAAGFTSSPLLQLTADVKLEIDPVNKVFKLTFTGQMTVYGLGTVGATAGFFELDMSNGLASVPQLWGVATLATNFTSLQKYGIDLYGTGTLQINLTEQVHVQTLTLPGLGPNGASETQTFTLQPLSFVFQIGGIAAITPPGSANPLVSLDGAFYLAINPGGMTIYATATLSYGAGPAALTYGSATGLIVIQTGLTPGQNPGVAGYLTVGAGANLGLPGVGNLFSISGSVTVMFNTTLQDISFTVPTAFLPLIPAGQATTINIWGSTPGLDGSRNPNAPAGGAVYVTAIIQAQITIGGVINMNGFLQITASASLSDGTDGVPAGDAELQITGAVGGQIPLLGAFQGQISWTYFLSTSDPLHNDGVVGREFMSFNASKIPGVSLSGDFMLEVNTFAAPVTIQTFAVQQDINGLYGGFVRDSAGNLTVTSTTITTERGFTVQMAGALTLANIATISGNVVFSLQLAGANAGISLVVNGNIDLGPLGHLKLKDSGFIINSQGLVANINLSAGVGDLGSGIGLGFSVTAILSLNTTGTTQMIGNTAVAAGFNLDLTGTVDFLGFASGSGSADITIGPGGFQIGFALQFNLGPLTFAANGAAGIYTGQGGASGIALALAVSASADGEVFSISASGMLYINTTNVTELGIAPESFGLSLNGSVDILKVIDFNTSISVVVGGPDPLTGNADGFWSFNANASMNFFGLATLSGSIYLDADGNFEISLSGSMTLGSSSFGLSGSFSFHLESRETSTNIGNPYYIFDLSGSADVGVDVFGISLADVGLSFSFHAEGSGSVPITLSVTVHVHILFVTVSKTAHFTIGYLQLPAPVYLAGNGTGSQAQAQSWSGVAPAAGNTTAVGSPLYLNVGTGAQYRDIGGDGTNDGYTIKQISGTATDATIQVTAFGRTNTFKGVSAIYADWSGQSCPVNGSGQNTCSESIDVQPGVHVPVHVMGSSGDDTIDYEGDNPATTLAGGLGNNDILASGPAAVTIYGDSSSFYSGGYNGAGDGYQNIIEHNATCSDLTQCAATIYGDGTNDLISTNNPNDTIFGGSGDIIVGEGKTINLGSGLNTVYLTQGSGSTVINGGHGGNDTFNLTAGPGNDSFSALSTSANNYVLQDNSGDVYTVNGVQNLVVQASGGIDTFEGFNVNANAIYLDPPAGEIDIADSTMTANGSDEAVGTIVSVSTTSITLQDTTTGSQYTYPVTLSSAQVTALPSGDLAVVTYHLVNGQPVADSAQDTHGQPQWCPSAGGCSSLESLASGPVTVTNSTLTATSGSISLISTGDVVTVTSSTLAAHTELTLNSAGALTVQSGTGGSTLSVSNGPMNLTSGSTLTVSGSSLTTSAGSISLTAPSDISVLAGTYSADKSTHASSLDANGTGGNISITDTGTGSLYFTGSSLTSGSGTVSLFAPTGLINAGSTSMQAAGTLTLNAVASSVTTTSGTSLTSTGSNVVVTAGTFINLGGSTVSATSGQATLTADGGTLTLGSTGVSANTVSASSATSDVNLQSASITVPSAGTVTLTGAQNVIVNLATFSGGANTLKATAGYLTLTASTLTVSSLTGTAHTYLTVTTTTSSTTGATSLTASGGDLTFNVSSVSATTTLGGFATNASEPNDVVVEGGSALSGVSGATLTAAGAISVTASSVASKSGNVQLTANGGDLSFNDGAATAGGTITGEANNATEPDDITIENTSMIAGDQGVTLTAAGAILVNTASSVASKSANVQLTANGGNLAFDDGTATAGGT
ncbi:MAG: hypothetical protein WAK93_03285, partial [Solirubrobacteraceae bacterium]